MTEGSNIKSYLDNNTGDVNLVNLPCHTQDNGEVIVIEGLVNEMFAIARVFMVSASEGSIRGQHAHKLCSQFLICTSGSIEVVVTDGSTSGSFELNHPNIGLYIPPGIWAKQQYQTNDARLTVLCDRIYESEDYIHGYYEFLNYRKRLVDLKNSRATGEV